MPVHTLGAFQKLALIYTINHQRYIVLKMILRFPLGIEDLNRWQSAVIVKALPIGLKCAAVAVLLGAKARQGIAGVLKRPSGGRVAIAIKERSDFIGDI